MLVVFKSQCKLGHNGTTKQQQMRDSKFVNINWLVHILHLICSSEYQLEGDNDLLPPSSSSHYHHTTASGWQAGRVATIIESLILLVRLFIARLFSIHKLLAFNCGFVNSFIHIICCCWYENLWVYLHNISPSS